MATRTEVKIRMLQKGLTHEAIASTLDVGRSAVCRVMNGHDRTPRLRKAIASALGWPESRIWPSTPARKPRAEQPAAQELA